MLQFTKRSYTLHILRIMDSSEILTTDANNLYLSGLKARSSSPNKESTQRFMRNLLGEVERARIELSSRAWKITPSRPFIINERGHTRKIEGNTPYDRMILHSYIDYAVEPILSRYLIYDNYASQVGKGVDLARSRFAQFLHKAYRQYGHNKFYVLLIDFAKFYDNIQHQKLFDVLMQYLPHESFHEYMLWTIFESFKVDVSYMSDEEYSGCLDTKYVALNDIDYIGTKEKFMYKSLNIGNQASQIFSIFYPVRIDNYLRIVNSEHFHGRYMDDTFIISDSKEHLRRTIAEVTEIAHDMGIFVHQNKTQIYRVDKNFKFLNRIYKMTDSGHLQIRLHSSTVDRECQKLKKYKRLIQDQTISLVYACNQFECWKGMFYKYMSKQQRERMNEVGGYLYETIYCKT